MSIPGKVLIALLCAVCVSALWTTFNADFSILALLGPSAAAAILAVILSHRALPAPAAIKAGDSAPATPSKEPSTARSPKKERSARAGGTTTKADKSRSRSSTPQSEKKSAQKSASKPEPGNAESRPAESIPTAAASGPKESGTVKWFNGTKGFGFIIRESGEEIFVHHRSIEGDGRRSLRDGAAVQFRVVETDKGPQAEDVESEE